MKPTYGWNFEKAELEINVQDVYVLQKVDMDFLMDVTNLSRIFLNKDENNIDFISKTSLETFHLEAPNGLTVTLLVRSAL